MVAAEKAVELAFLLIKMDMRRDIPHPQLSYVALKIFHKITNALSDITIPKVDYCKDRLFLKWDTQDVVIEIQDGGVSVFHKNKWTHYSDHLDLLNCHEFYKALTTSFEQS